MPLKEKFYAHGFFHLVKPAIWISRGWDYTSNAIAFQRGLKDRVHRTDENAVMVARWFNVWIGTLVCLAVYLLVRRITDSSWAGVFGAALLGLAQYPVEHSHYAETDMAMLLCLATALWLIAVAVETRRKLVFILAALVVGFAVGTKFTLYMLLPVILVLSVTFDRPSLSLKTCVRAGGLFLAGLVCFLLGFMVAMPEVTDLGWFFKGMAHEKARIFGETALNLGPLRNDSQVRYMMHARELLESLSTLGWGWLILAAGGLPCLALRAFRRFWTITLLFPILFLIYWIFQAPWVRSQEFMILMPVLAVWAAVLLVVFWRYCPGWWRPAVIVLAAIALATNGINGCRAASLFGWTDTRLLAKQWLQTHMPPQRTIATENYADYAWVDTGKPPVCIRKVEKEGLTYLRAQAADYLLRAASNAGRGLQNPLTDTLYPEPCKLFDEFIRESEKLRAWAPLPPQGLATFVSPAIELYGLKRFPFEYKINLELPQPLWVNNYIDGTKGRQTFFPVGHKLGAATGVLIDHLPRVIAVGGPEAPQGPVYLILNTAEREAAVNIRGFGQMRQATLAPYAAAIVPLERSRRHPRLSQFEEITLCTERVEGVLFVPCFARVAFSPSEAARICLDLGAEEAVWKTFSEQDLAQTCDPTTVYLLAVRSARWALAGRLEAAAGRVESALTAMARSDPAAVRLNGNSGYYYNEFARVRMDEVPRKIAGPRDKRDVRQFIQETTTKVCLDMTAADQPAPGRAPLYEAALQLPVRLARGRYIFYGEITTEAEGATNAPAGAAFEFYYGQPEQRLACPGAVCPDTWAPLTFEFPVARETQPRFIVRTHTPAKLYIRNTEIRWNLASVLDSVRNDLAVAHAAQAVAGGKQADALRRLTGLEAQTNRWNELEIRQLALAAARGPAEQTARQHAARRLLELAPEDYAGLQVLAETDPVFKAMAIERSANLKVPVEFDAGLNLVGFALDSGARKVHCVWEARKNETPVMAANFWIRRHGEWRKKQVQLLGERQWLARGERVVMEVKLSEAFAGYPDDAIALGLETAAEWHPGVLSVAGSGEPVVPLSVLARQTER